MHQGQAKWEESIKDLKRQTLKRVIIYLLMIGSLVGNLYHLDQRGYSFGNFLLQSSVPHFKGTLTLQTFLEQSLYNLTQVMIGEPYTLLTGAMPYLESCEQFKTIYGEASGYFEQDEKFYVEENREFLDLPSEPVEAIDPEKFKDTYYVLKNYITGDGDLKVDLPFLKQWNFYDLMTRPLKLKETNDEPQVLIFHTHSRESYRGGTTIVDAGELLKETLEKQYGIKVLHTTDSFYPEGSSSVTGAYERMEPVIKQILADNPSISMCIDLHRDGVNKNIHLVTEIQGKQTAKIMFVNGLCMNRNVAGDIVQKTDLPNPYVEDNLALSIQAQAVANTYYPGLMRKIYLNEWRFSTHMKPLSLLIELGADTNTGEEALNAIGPLSNIIAKVLQKD